MVEQLGLQEAAGGAMSSTIFGLHEAALAFEVVARAQGSASRSRLRPRAQGAPDRVRTCILGISAAVPRGEELLRRPTLSLIYLSCLVIQGLRPKARAVCLRS